MAWLFASRDGMRRFYWAWLLVMSWVGLFGITHGGRGPGGFLGDENDLALACVATFPFAFYGFQLLGGWQRWLSGGCGFVLVMATVVSASRGGFLGLVAALLYCVFTSAHKVRNFLVGLLAAGVFFVAIPQSYVGEIVSIKNTDQGTADARQFLWLTAWNVWKDHPVIGVGGGNFNNVAGRYTPKGGHWDKPEYQERDYSGTTVHSMYFQALSELGSIGVVAYGVMVVGHFRGVSRIRKQVRKRKDLPRALKDEIELYGGSLAAGMIGALGSGAFLSSAYYPYTFLFAGAGVALVAWGARVQAEETMSRGAAREAGPRA
jgi:O-antigen ligase